MQVIVGKGRKRGKDGEGKGERERGKEGKEGRGGGRKGGGRKGNGERGKGKEVTTTGLEPMTLALLARCSNQLS